MKENKRYIATPITEEQKEKIREIKDIVAQKHGYADWYQIDMTDREPWERNEIMLSLMQEVLELTLIEQPLPSSVTAEEIKSKDVIDVLKEFKTIQHDDDLDYISLPDAAEAIKKYAQLQTAAPSFPQGVTNKVKLEETKDIRRLHIGSFFTDLNESEYLELVRIFSKQSSFPSDEEIEKEAKYRFTDGHGAEDIYSIDIFKNACQWLLSYKEQTKNKGGKE